MNAAVVTFKNIKIFRILPKNQTWQYLSKFTNKLNIRLLHTGNKRKLQIVLQMEMLKAIPRINLHTLKVK